MGCPHGHCRRRTDRRALGGSWLRRVLIGLGVAGRCSCVLYFVGGAIWVHEIDDDPAFDAEVVVPDERQPRRGGGGGSDRPRGQPEPLGRQRPVLPAGLSARQHARLPDRDRQRGRAVHDRAARPGGAGARLERGRPRSRERCRAAQLSRRRLDLRVVGHARAAELGEPVSARASRICAATTSGWRRARRCTSGGPTTCWRRWTGSPATSAPPRRR